MNSLYTQTEQKSRKWSRLRAFFFCKAYFYKSLQGLFRKVSFQWVVSLARQQEWLGLVKTESVFFDHRSSSGLGKHTFGRFAMTSAGKWRWSDTTWGGVRPSHWFTLMSVNRGACNISR